MAVKRKIKQLERRCFTERERVIDGFYKDFLSWVPESIGAWIAVGFCELFALVFLCTPYQVAAEMRILMLCGIWGGTWYISPYLRFKENNQQVKLSDKLKYLPVAQKELQNYCMKKLLIFLLKMFLVFLVGQLFFAVVVYHKITVWNFLHVLGWGFILPFSLNAIMIKFMK